MNIKNFLIKLFKRFLGSECFYVGSTDTLPPPLSDEAEAEAIRALPDENAKNTLIEHDLRLVVYIAKKFENTGISLEDLTSIGTIGLIKAVNSFNNEKAIKLATYASRCIENEILMVLRSEKKLVNEVSIE